MRDLLVDFQVKSKHGSVASSSTRPTTPPPSPMRPRQEERPLEKIEKNEKKEKEKEKEKGKKKKKDKHKSEAIPDDIAVQRAAEQRIFLDLAAQLRSDEAELDAHITAFTLLCDQSSKVVNDVTASKYASEIEASSQNISSYASSFRQRLKQLNDSNKSFELSEFNTDADKRMHRLQCTTLTNHFLQSIKRFQQEQEKYAQRLRDQMARQYKIVKPDATEEELNEITKGEGRDLLQLQVFAIGKKATLEELQTRQTALEKMEKTIIELAQMFADMSLMVKQQGEQIDQIDKHVQDARAYVEQATKTMENAVVLQKKHRCCIL